MTGFFLSFLACLLIAMGGRDQMTLAGLSARQGPRPAVLVVAVLTATAVSLAMAMAAGVLDLLALLPTRRLVVAAALALAGLELLVERPVRIGAEPTRSLFATALVLLWRQWGDAARFLVFALALATHAAIPAGLGGALGSAAALALGWHLGEALQHPWLARARMALGALLLLGGLLRAIDLMMGA